MPTEVNSGLEGVVAAETTISLVDGQAGRLLYRGYEIGDLAAHGSYDRVVGLLLDGEWPAARRGAAGGGAVADRCWPRCAGCPPRAPRWTRCAPGSRRSAPSGGWTGRRRRAGARADRAGAGRGRRVRPPARRPRARSTRPEAAHLGIAGRLLHAISGEQPDPAKARALDAYFTVCAEHGLNASTFTARVITSTQSDLASAVCGAVGALKGRLHGGAPSARCATS